MGIRIIHQNDLHDIADAAVQLSLTTLYAVVYRRSRRIDIYSLPNRGRLADSKAILTASVTTHPDNVYKVLGAFERIFEHGHSMSDAIKDLEQVTR